MGLPAYFRVLWVTLIAFTEHNFVNCFFKQAKSLFLHKILSINLKQTNINLFCFYCKIVEISSTNLRTPAMKLHKLTARTRAINHVSRQQLNESCTLISSAVTRFTLAILLQDSLILLMRIPHGKMSKFRRMVTEKLA